MSEPLLCPRCGDVSRFSSVSELRVHLIIYHTYETLLLLSKARVRSSRRRALLSGPTEAQSWSSSLGSELQDGPLSLERLVLPWGGLKAVLLVDVGLEERLGLGACLGAKVARALGEVERRVTRRVTRLTSDLYRKEAELKEQLQNEERLRRETQELRERVELLTEQLCAVMEATEKLKKDLEEKEQELNRRQQEMEDIEGFLTDLAEKEANAKAKLQVFMEWLLERADRAESHLMLLTSHRPRPLSPELRYQRLPEVSPGGGGVRGGVSLDDIITDRYREALGNRRSFSVSCPLQHHLHHLHRGPSPPMRTLSLDSQDSDSDFRFQTRQLRSDTTPDPPRFIEEGWGQTWSRPLHHSTEEEEGLDRSKTTAPEKPHSSRDL